MTPAATAPEPLASGPPIVSQRLSITAQISALMAAGEQVDTVLELAHKQRQAADDELYAARLVAQNAVIPGTQVQRRWSEAAGRAAARASRERASNAIERGKA